MTALRTEADLLRTLDTGTYEVGDLYARAEAAGLRDRPGGRDRAQDGKERYKHRIRTALQGARRRGRAHPVEGGKAAWFIEGTHARPRRALFVWLPSDPSQVELVLGKAADVLAQADEPIDLIVADPPWGLDRGDRQTERMRRAYGRDASKVMPGYVEVDPEQYEEFTAEWMTAATAAIRPGGYLAVFTGPEQQAQVQITGQRIAGLTYVNKIPVPRTWGMYSTRRFVHAHTEITVLTKGNLYSSARTFTRPPEMPRGPKGEVYAADFWTDMVADDRRPGLLRYDNALHPAPVSRIVRSTTRRGDLVADPFNGSGTTATVCLLTGRRFYGGDLNEHSLRFTMGRLLAETVPSMPHPGQLMLLDPEGALL